ncbi:hypothetical protein SARC_05614 [Sphaeroforma arctica JP610]|uniref:Integrase zinc-binding domain-containing protein n=1 Tax=Sphaeroforma arctica JP610 TaxID=667725 RepID=A0A0L0FZS8_9EUKA|nr:hypothetical protein SARC_05614 [Sphaeroforma arctica JP610]KNC82104.1 hypothetical protein SARC_05614 [Sphaeroforma arctica JP610]|eukprot:XP_014156006.1 hypothetical protein SARC_05614 [Sphaeroforma arctica JP610]
MGRGNKRIGVFPWELISDVLDKVIEEATRITICVPYYPNTTWFPKFLSLLEQDPMIVENTNNTFLNEGTTVCGKTPLVGTLVAKIGTKSPCFDQKLAHPAIKIVSVQTDDESAELDTVTFEDRVTLISQYHSVGHYTVEETVNKLQLNGHTWSRQKEHVNQYIEGCVPCLKYKSTKRASTFTTNNSRISGRQNTSEHHRSLDQLE